MTSRIENSRRIAFGILLLLTCRPIAAGAGIYYPPCEIKDDPDQTEFEILPTCLEASIGTWVQHRSLVEEGHLQPARLFAGRGKITILPSKWLILQSSAEYKLWQERESANVLDKDMHTDSVTLQIGNSALNRHRILIGRSRQPFGVNQNTIANWSGYLLEDLFYGPKNYLASYTYDNQKDLTWTTSIGAKEESKRNASARDSTVSSRLSFDLAALEGTRILTSFSTTELSQRRGGIALVNRNGKGEQTTFEVIRVWTEFPYDPIDFNQLIRTNWSGKASEDLRVSAQFEDVWQQHRIGNITLKQMFTDQLSLDGTIGFYRTENQLLRSHWFGALGIEASL
jgi:hypothetical protein